MSYRIPSWFLVLSLWCFAHSASAQMAKAPHYRPPMPDAPVVRVDGHSRGPDDVILTLTVLAPEHVGLTTKEQPSLFWYQSKAAKTRFELTIMEAKGVEPILEVKLHNPSIDGIQRLRLSDYSARLKPAVEYRWTVAMIVDPDNRSRDVVASGVIRRVEPPTNLKNRLAKSSPAEVAFVYADEGIWYDSLEALSDEIENQPQNKGLHEQRAVFFLQVGLKEAALHEMKLASASPVLQH
jgi:hypothetical protein